MFFLQQHPYFLFIFFNKSFFRVAVNMYVPIFRGLDARGGRKLRTDTHIHTHTYIHTHIHGTTTVTLVARMCAEG